MEIVLLNGFSRLRSIERLEVLLSSLEKRFPEAIISVIEYFELRSYGKIRKFFFRRKNIKDYAKIVLAQLQDRIREPPILIGYSMGGLLARYLVEKLNFPAKAVILVGTPNCGIRTNWWERLLILNVPCLKELTKPQRIFANLSEVSQENYYFIGGISDTRVPLNSSIPPGIRNKPGSEGKVFLISCGHSQLIPRSTEEQEINNSAIPAILSILKSQASL